MDDVIPFCEGTAAVVRFIRPSRGSKVRMENKEANYVKSHLGLL